MSETQNMPMFIGGKFVEAASKQTYEVKNPARRGIEEYMEEKTIVVNLNA